ncbi:hypothetical protein LAC81_26645 [Ensifer adhaerens]|uniref:hypothetical protein n=1 Tax=Ensifer adhaerens TaxID=106592 RepID=UPI001CC0F58D|nr:hypothetical protein [Ensifer adhaerens]MBZ7924308.1 hypothetical protein [Ensifer adhaerens]UAX96441.1 hypothetical protein LAC78_21840 [Ensifer adhaerens]UAY04216.1 hypothetical protein LAC80_23120 [Ensifer adhaerens]UAY12202.1 hypothetical protein LAC81_26645 [Ensifer adhaerens]
MNHIDFFRKHHKLPNEEVIGFVAGWNGATSGINPKHHGILVLTDCRVSFVRHGFVGSCFRATELDRIRSVEFQSRMMRVVATFHTSYRRDLVFSSLNTTDLRSLVNGVNHIRLNAIARGCVGVGGAFAEIEELLDLREASGQL